jgi:hypothetical protein
MILYEERKHLHAEILHNIERLVGMIMLCLNNTMYKKFIIFTQTKCQLLRIEGVAWSAQQIPTAVNLGFLDPEPLLFHSSSSSVSLTRLSGPRSSPTTSQKIW